MGLSDQVTQLRAANERIAAETTAAGERVSALVQSLKEKIVSLGEVDPDLSGDVAKLDTIAEQLKQIGVEAPAPAPVEPAPVEPLPTEPA